jgi:hypothetical protein
MTALREASILCARILSAGIWPALPLTGYWLLPADVEGHRGGTFPALTSLAIYTVAGIVVWSGGMLAAAAARIYRGTYFGLAGWVVVLVSVLAASSSGGLALSAAPSWSIWEWILAGGLVLAAVLYLGYPNESIIEANDMGVYANHGIFIARHGRLSLPYPWAGVEPVLAQDLMEHRPHRGNIFRNHVFLGFQKNGPRMTAEFGHVWPVWLAQAFSTAGPAGLFRLNGLFALLALGAFYGLCLTVVPLPMAVAATLFLALVPSQVWIARTTLSEVFAQCVFCVGLLLFLQALKTSWPAGACWAGACMALAVLIRCDCLLIVPLVVFAQFGGTLGAQSADEFEHVWRSFYKSAVPGSLVAVSYFAFFSRPYFRDQLFYFRLIGLGAVLSITLLLTVPPLLSDVMRERLTAMATADIVGVGLALFAAYAYWVRPAVVHYRLDWADHPHHGEPHRAEYSLQDLGRYVSRTVLVAAIAGWWLVLRDVLERPAWWLLPWLVISAAYSGLYLYDPCDDPHHFWRVRRYVPIIIPAFIFFAAIAGSQALDQLPAAWREPAVAVAVVGLVAFTIRRGRRFWWRQENRGMYEQVRSLAELIPSDDLVFAKGKPAWVTPLYVAFDRRVVPIGLNGEEGWELLARWTSRRICDEKPAYLLCEDRRLLPQHARELGQMKLSRTIVEPTIYPVPRRFVCQEMQVVLLGITNMLEPPDVVDVPLGGRPFWRVAEEGFHDQEMFHGQPARWTNGHGRLLVPVREGSWPDRVLVDLAMVAPQGSSFRVLANGRELHHGVLAPRRGWLKELPLTDVPVDSLMAIDLISDSFIPADLPDEPADCRRLGVLVREVRLLRHKQTHSTA